jgi:hypothetical protein
MAELWAGFLLVLDFDDDFGLPGWMTERLWVTGVVAFFDPGFAVARADIAPPAEGSVP